MRERLSEYIEIDRDIFITDKRYIGNEVGIILGAIQRLTGQLCLEEYQKKNLVDWLSYTVVHKQAILALFENLKDRPNVINLEQRLYTHDLDKLILYALYIPIGKDPRKLNELHVIHNSHHLKSLESATYSDLLEAWFDYESSSLTKVDKPLNAYEFIKRKKPEYLNAFNPVFNTLGVYRKPIVYTEEMHRKNIRYLCNILNIIVSEINRRRLNLSNPVEVSSMVNTLLLLYR